ncbi:tetratricopeptide repeat protein [Galbibacter pacificus]|uniref:Tetratricopeptide repeat protein n=1 Tax=Galbibacter pacificus TaxID=2996052 RepID=A0ABT6FSP9_9FLAO|nr:tetratricopeptide repeat protein [Galbibacter pacificus]MDG3582590.1 tetratricopeptide repeat protein [Galbibacter pacificus]MDG3586291.1 tetratricopeptide repeat protein [Galbibacter pacificus]
MKNINYIEKTLFFILFIPATLLNAQHLTTDSLLSKQVNSRYLELKHALESARASENDSLIANSYLQFAHFYKKTGAINEALANYQQAEKYKPHIKDTALVDLYLQMGKIHFSVKHYQTASKQFLKALQLSKTIEYIKGRAMANGYVGSCFEKLSNYKDALKYQKTSLELFEQIEDSLGLALVNENIGSIYEDKEQYKVAYQYFKRALDYMERQDGQFDRKLNIINNMGDVNRKKENYKEALMYTLKAKNLAEKSHNYHQLESAYKDLSKTYGLLNDFEQAYINLGISDSINETIIRLQNVQQINALQALYDANSKEAKIDLLTKENEVNKAQERLMLIFIIALLGLIFGVYVYLKKRKQHELNIEKYKQQALEANLEKKKLIEENLQREIELKTSSLSKYSLNLAQKNRTLSQVAHTLTNIKGRKKIDVDAKLNEIVLVINEDLSEKQEWNQFMDYFEQIHPSFFKNLRYRTEEELSITELRLCMLLRLGLSSKEIASILRVTPDSIRVARYRLRKKLSINQGDKLTRFLQQL